MPTVNVYGTDTIASSGRAPPWGLGHDPPTALSGLGGATATREAQDGVARLVADRVMDALDAI